jgi:vacuolar protein sorting-associated protein 18
MGLQYSVEPWLTLYVEQDLTQRMILATWLVEFYLSKCNELDDMIASRSISQDVENLKAERTILEEEIRQFFVTYKVRSVVLWLALNLTDVS